MYKSDVNTFYGNGSFDLRPTHKLVDQQWTHSQLSCIPGDHLHLLEVWLYQTIHSINSDRQSVTELLNLWPDYRIRKVKPDTYFKRPHLGGEGYTIITIIIIIIIISSSSSSSSSYGFVEVHANQQKSYQYRNQK